jgi:methionyl-tRNA formyltransferase
LRLLCLANNWLGWQVLQWLAETGEEIVGLVVHPSHKRQFADDIIAAAGVAPEHVFDGSQLRQPAVVDSIRALQPDLAVSVLFGYLLRPEFLALFKQGAINLHPSYLPYNRGAYPNVWSIVNGTPAGVTIHHIAEGLDTGDIIAQQAVAVEPVDTGLTLYRKLERAGLDLFRKTWPGVRAGKAPRLPQASGEGTSHRARDVEEIDLIDLDRSYTARALIDLLRARTFPPYPGAYFEANGKKIYLRLELYTEESSNQASARAA